MVAIIAEMFLRVTKFDFVFPCSRPSEDRTIPLSVIAERTKLTVEDVEYLLMKSLSVSPQSDIQRFMLNTLFVLICVPLLDSLVLFMGSTNNVFSCKKKE